jgi:hypothetical protein
MFSIKNFFSALMHYNRFVLIESEIKRSPPNDSGLYRYARFELVRDKSYKTMTLTRDYHTALVQDEVSYEDAMKNSISSKFNLDADKDLLNRNENRNIGITYLDYEHGWGKIWEFEDGSYIEETMRYTQRSEGLIRQTSFNSNFKFVYSKGKWKKEVN